MRPDDLLFESGRALAATCGVLHTAVVDGRQTSRGELFVVLDAGVNARGFNGLGRLLVPAVTLLRPVDGPDRPLVEATLVGPLCTPLDIHHRRIKLPAPEPGEILTIPNAGAYGLSATGLSRSARGLRSGGRRRPDRRGQAHDSKHDRMGER